MSNVVSQKDQILYGQGHELIQALVRAGMNREDVQVVIEDSRIAQKITDLIKDGGYEETTSQRLAREIMGENFLGVKEIRRFFGYKIAENELFYLDKRSFSQKTLEQRKDSYILFPAISLSLAELVKDQKNKVLISYLSQEMEEQYAQTVSLGLRWYLIKKDPFVDRENFGIEKVMREYVPAVDELPTACEVVFLLMLWQLVRGKPLWKGYYISTRDITNSGGRVIIGTDDQSGCIYFSHNWNEIPALSYATSRKSI